MNDHVHIDLETYSEIDLSEVGVYRYAEDPSTEILLCEWAAGDGPVHVWLPCISRDTHPVVALIQQSLPQGTKIFVGQQCPEPLAEAMRAARPGQLRAHNAQFERVMLRGQAGRRLGVPDVTTDRWACTAAKAAVMGLPRHLGDAAAALGSHPKDSGGRTIMLQLSKPRTGKAAKESWPNLPRYTPDEVPEKFARLVEYCYDDVLAERDLDNRLPELSPKERRVWLLDQLINDRGVAVDLESVRNVIHLVGEYRREMEVLCREWTGFKPTQRAEIVGWVRANGYPQILDMQKETVVRAVKDPACPERVRDVLKLYSTYGMKAVSKFDTILRAVCSDGRLHGMFLYYGAGTGRWSSLIVQLQNLFRPVIKDCDEAIEAFRVRQLAWIRTIYDIDPMKVMASCIRSVLVPAKGKKFIVFDFAGIESRKTAWVAGERWKLKAFHDYDRVVVHEGQVVRDEKGKPKRGGPDTYKLAYASTFSVPVESVTDKQRQIGKVEELALGYEGGVGAFVTMTATYGVNLQEMTESLRGKLPAEALDHAEWMHANFGTYAGLTREQNDTCNAVKYLWRQAHPAVVKLWKDLRTAAVMAILNPGKVYRTPNGKVGFSVRGDWLRLMLPSGRVISYYKPEAKYVGPKKEADHVPEYDDDIPF